ncbi:MAG: hypothetical protein JW703_03075 [Candidatus Diapherotrites archaeon]|nr:hypothetical protein [Candidatus Diapherotrites archaeon]
MASNVDVSMLFNQEHTVSVVLSKAQNYFSSVTELIKKLVNEQKLTGVYVSLNRPAETIITSFEQKGIDLSSLIFIDGVTKNSGNKGKAKNTIFVDSPKNLTDLGIALTQAVNGIKTENKFVFFDSISTLLVYNSFDKSSKFAHFLALKMRDWKVKGMILSLEKESDSEMLEQMKMFVDNVIEV